MDVNAVANLATAQSNARTRDQIDIAVLNKALDAQTLTAASLIESMNSSMVTPAKNLPPNLGQNVNTTA